MSACRGRQQSHPLDPSSRPLDLAQHPARATVVSGSGYGNFALAWGTAMAAHQDPGDADGAFSYAKAVAFGDIDGEMAQCSHSAQPTTALSAHSPLTV